ncbi:MAG: hypothetical protein MK198_13945 [Gracilimonas sp.]|uniref:MGH1-like glycoside hydrolase domain-containing protein n=1 Tax=Gracilimonas sp. TaxID=1974203 RepID=UPI003751A797|nr:hypothetical protein [Gracilimonas sp.]
MINQYSILSVLVLFALGFAGCNSPSSGHDAKPELSNFPNVLNVHGTPQEPEDDNISIITDLGSWFGFAISDNEAAFVGPYFLSESYEDLNIWQSADFNKWELQENGEPLSPAAVRTEAYPGRLVQHISYAEMEVENTLFYANENSVVIRAELENFGKQERSLQPSWSTSLFEENFEAEAHQNGIKVEIKNSTENYEVLASEPVTFQKEEKGYRIKLKNALNIEPGQNETIYLVYSTAENKAGEVLENAEQKFQENTTRWNQYVQSVLNDGEEWMLDESRRRLAVKSLLTLVNNWRSPRGDLNYEGLFPSYAYQGFHGVWSWDSWKHAVAIAGFDVELAKNQLRVMFDYQNKAGMIPDVIYADSTQNNWRDTKPPLSAWAVWSIFEQSEDLSFLEEMYPKLKKYHAWWYIHRDHDQNGLCEYGSTDGTRIAAAWESGMDNAVRFDDAVMIKNNDSAWSLNQESVDLNAYLYAEKNYLAQMAETLGYPDEATRFQKEAEELKALINNKMYDAETGYYYDKVLESDSLIVVQGPEGWIPLWAGIASPEQAEAVKEIMMDSLKFNSFVPLPTLQISHAKFNPKRGYWRGPVWLDQFYFGVKGLTNYGFSAEASLLTQKLITNAEGLLDSGAPIRENYHPISGEGLNARHFSWSSAHLLMLSRLEVLKF